MPEITIKIKTNDLGEAHMLVAKLVKLHGVEVVEAEGPDPADQSKVKRYVFDPADETKKVDKFLKPTFGQPIKKGS